MLEIDILKNYHQNILGVLRADFLGFGCPNVAQMHGLLAKTMQGGFVPYSYRHYWVNQGSVTGY